MHTWKLTVCSSAPTTWTFELRHPPPRLELRRRGRRLLDGVVAWACEGSERDRLITITEGVVCDEAHGVRESAVAAEVLQADARRAELRPTLLLPRRRRRGWHEPRALQQEQA